MPKVKRSILKGVARVRRTAQKAGFRKGIPLPLYGKGVVPMYGGRTASGHKQTASQKSQVESYKRKERKKTKRTLRRAWRKII